MKTILFDSFQCETPHPHFPMKPNTKGLAFLHTRPTSSEKRWAAFAYFLGIIGCILTVIKNDSKKSPYIQLHVVQAFVFHFTFIVANILTSGFSVFLYVPISIWFAYQAYKGIMFEIPVVTTWLIRSGYFNSVKDLL